MTRNAAALTIDKRYNSHAWENLVEHLFLTDVLRHMWFERGQVVEVAKAEVDSWGYDVVLGDEEPDLDRIVGDGRADSSP